MNRMAKSNPDRVYRAARLLPEEAQRLDADAGNEFETCCPHLEVFHRGDYCSLCGCEGDADAVALRAEVLTQRAAQAAADVAADESLMRFTLLTGAGAGGAVVALAWVLWTVFR